MRLVPGMTIGLAVVAGLVACGPSEEAQRNTLRESLLVDCRAGSAAERTTLAQSGIDVEGYCTCSVDRYVRSLVGEQLKQVADNPANAPGLEAAARQCMSEMVRAAPPLAAGNQAAGENDAAAGNAAGNDTDGQ